MFFHNILNAFIVKFAQFNASIVKGKKNSFNKNPN